MAFLTGVRSYSIALSSSQRKVAAALAVIISAHRPLSSPAMQSSTSGSTLERLGREGRLNRRPRAAARGRPDQPDFYLSGRHAHGRAARGVAVGGGDFCQQCFVCAVHRRPGFRWPFSIRVSQARGSGDREAARAALRHGLYLALAVGALTMLGSLGIQPFLGFFHQDPEIIRAVPRYFSPHRGVDDSGNRRDGSEESRRRHATSRGRPLDHAGSGRIERAVQLALHLRKSRRASSGARRVRGGHIAGATGDARRHDLVVACASEAVRDWVPIHWFRARRNGRWCAS